MKPVKYFLVMNPRSHSGKSAGKFDRIFSLMEAAGLEYEYAFAETYRSILDTAAMAVSGDSDVIVAVGGDGTINATINGFYLPAPNAGANKKFGVIYTGTSPDFCKSYGVPLDTEKAVSALERLKVRKILIGKIELATNKVSAERDTRYFSCCASIGIGAGVAETANRFRKYAGDTMGTLGAIFHSLATFSPLQMILDYGDNEKTIDRVTNIFVGRTNYIASGLKVNADLSDDDPRFYVICVNDLKLKSLPGLLRQLYSGNIFNTGVIDYFFTGNITIKTPSGPARVEFDGDAAGFTACSIVPAAFPINLIIT